MELIISFILAIAINILMFIPAFYFKTDKLTNISYAITFIFLSIFLLISFGVTIPSIILVVAIIIWAVRLGGYLLIRIHKMGKDNRFDEMRSNFWSFGKFWLLQGLTVWIVLIPSVFFLSKEQTEFSWQMFLGLIIFIFGLVIETIADLQKFNFITNSSNNGKWIDSGLWKYSRHPNYFGEIVLWFGLYIYVLPVLNLTEALAGLIGPVFISFLIMFVSGIPLLEKSADKKWGNDPNYQNYKNKTSIFVPWFRKVY